MLTFDLLIPWITLAAVLIPLLYVQRWIHRHLFGMGFLLSREKQAATLFYYLFLLPGVFLHEFSHYMMAGVFGVRPKHFTFFPHAQEDGSLEMGFLELEQVKNPIYAAVIGIAPLISGMLVVVYISNNILILPGFFAMVQNADITTIGIAVQRLVTLPDFPLWFYILFAVANAMMPGTEDRRGWWVIGAAVGIVVLFLTIIGLQQIAVNLLQGPIAKALSALTAVFGTVLAVDLVFAVIIWVIEAVLERATGHRVEYGPALAAGASAALAAGPQLKSVYDLKLPIPPAPGKVLAKPAPARLPAGDRPAIPAGQPARPGIPAAAGQPAGGSLTRPAPKPGSAPSPFGAAPARPAAQASGAPGVAGGQPAKPAAPISGPPALARPATSAPAKPNLPATTGAAKPPTPGQPAAPQRPRFGSTSDNDYIDADVIDEDEEIEDEDQSISPFGKKPASPASGKASDDEEDKDDLKYVDEEDL